MAKKMDGWDLLEQGRYDEAISRFYEEYEQDKQSFPLYNVSLAYLLKDEPRLAAQVMEEKVLPQRNAGTDEFALAGVAHWIAGEPEPAVDLWRKGRGCQYADASGGMGVTLLLYYASVRRPKLVSLTEATSVIKEQLRHRWASSWPGPLGLFVLDEVSEDKIREMAVFKHELVTRRQMLQVDFYVGLKAERLRHHAKFAVQMEQCASTQGCELATEFYLARCEVANHQ